MKNILSNGIALSAINNISYVAPGMGKNIHRNRSYHGFVYYHSSDCAFHFDSEVIQTESGGIIYLPKGSDYRVERLSEPKGCYAINFSTFDDISEKPFCLKLKNYGRAEMLFKNAEKLWKTQTPENISKCKSAFYEILGIMQHEASLQYVPNKKKQKLRPAIDHIHQHYTEGDISVEYLAELCEMSSTYFRRLFSNIYGISPVKYINDIKINRAKELLMSDMYPIEEVSYLSGFSDSCYFRKVFRAGTKLTPTEYKSLLKNGNIK